MPAPDLLVLSHLRWGFVFQRPQHLMTRFARDRRVFFVEEPVFSSGREARLEVVESAPEVRVAVPHLPSGEPRDVAVARQRALIDELVAAHGVREPIAWYYTPMALPFAGHLPASAVVYDCMDELSAFLGAPPQLVALERELLGRADLVFTGGQSLFEAKRNRHPAVHAFPSSVDAQHFASARSATRDPDDQAPLRRPRLGYFGVIDERLDTELVAAVADARPSWELVFVGPVVKIDPATLPRRRNVHWLGAREYRDLPAYLAGWDVAMMPFARNAATEFISPTKTLEYLAGGKPVVSTPIRDVVRPYGEAGVVRIASTAEEWVAAAEAAMREDRDERWARADAVLSQTSWDRTHARMRALIADAIDRRRAGKVEDREDATCTTI